MKITLPLGIVRAAYRVAWRHEDTALAAGDHEEVAFTAQVAADLLDAIGEQAGQAEADVTVAKARLD